MTGLKDADNSEGTRIGRRGLKLDSHRTSGMRNPKLWAAYIDLLLHRRANLGRAPLKDPGRVERRIRVA
jgi:hypothetical protein